MSQKPARILVVEDEEAMAAGLDYALTRDGYEVTLVRDPGQLRRSDKKSEADQHHRRVKESGKEAMRVRCHHTGAVDGGGSRRGRGPER